MWYFPLRHFVVLRRVFIRRVVTSLCALSYLDSQTVPGTFEPVAFEFFFRKHFWRNIKDWFCILDYFFILCETEWRKKAPNTPRFSQWWVPLRRWCSAVIITFYIWATCTLQYVAILFLLTPCAFILLWTEGFKMLTMVTVSLEA